MSATRKLAAILAADVVGYSSLTGADEEGTIARLRALRRELIDPAITEHHGRIVKTTGDGILIEFASVVDAVRCAIAVQRGMARRNTEVSVEKRILFRIGINLGDVVAEGDDLLGDGVNVAARLEGIAEPGGICLSRATYDQARGKIDLAVKDLGEQRLKNIAEPVQVYSVSVNDNLSFGGGVQGKIPSGSNREVSGSYRHGAGIAGAAAVLIAIAVGSVWFATRSGPPQSSASMPRFSIVVLPFTNLSGDPAGDYLADVITEGLTTSLSRISGSFVIARTTALTYKGKPVDVKHIARDLGVRYVLEGGEQMIGTSVRVTAQLIDAESGAHLWADQFDTDRANLLQMQDEVVTRLARALEIQLWEVNTARLLRTNPSDPEAEDLAVQCKAAYYTGRPDYSLCERALQIDPHNVRAMVLIAWKLIEPAASSALRATEAQSEIQRADALLTQALAIDPNYYAAHQVKGWVLFLEKRYDEAIAAWERTLALNPAYVDSYAALAETNNILGRPEKAIEYTDKAIRLSPRDPFLSGFLVVEGIGFFQLRRDDLAIPSLRRSAALYPGPWSQASLIAALALNEQ